MEDLTIRIRRVTEDLRAIQAELNTSFRTDITDRERLQLLDELLNRNVVNDLKSAVDHMRQFLWAYIEAASGKRGGDADLALQTLRLQRVTEMLRVLRDRLETPSVKNTPEARSFFEELQAIADTAVKKHSASKQ